MLCSWWRAAKIALNGVALLLAALIWYRHSVTDASDPYKCDVLQSGGRWVGKHRGPYTPDKFLHWITPGCLLHKYNARDIDSCLQCGRFLFVGDSTIRQVYWATARKLDAEKAAQKALSAEKHASLQFNHGCVQIDFLWDPFLNSTGLKSELDLYKLHAGSRNSTRIAAMLVGTGLWHAKDLGADFLQGFERSIDSVAVSLPHNARDTNAVFRPPRVREESRNLVLFAPVPVPIQSKLDPSRAATLTPGRIQAMNGYLQSASTIENFEVLWSYSLMTWQRPFAHEANGIHVVENVADRQADIFLNTRCNAEPSSQHYPFDKTCCNVQPPVNGQQRLLIVLGVISVLSGLYVSVRSQPGNELGVNLPWTGTTARAAGSLAIAVLYCFAADRTLIFDRHEKMSDQRTFLQLMTLVVFGGLVTIRRSGNRSTNLSAKAPGALHDQPFLSRDQTDEWKGWMQFVILAYHYTGVSSVLWVYQIVRLLVASYLFMTGYGHTLYFLKTNDFSLRRVGSVLVRLNMVSCLLAYVMRTDYQFYYFPALVSTWYLVLYCTLRVLHKPEEAPRRLALKILVSAILSRLVASTTGPLELVFKVMKLTFKVNVDVHEFRFRFSLDTYTVYAGMLAAVMCLQIMSGQGGLPCSTTPLATQLKRIPTTVRVLGLIASAITLLTYFIVIRKCPDKYDYNRWHPMISPLPILAFVVLRNATQGLRNYHSELFAWLGRFSLETFIFQYHIWLAADTKALLSLGLWTRDSVMGKRWLDNFGWLCEFILITALFVWTSLSASHATTALTSAIVDGQQREGATGILRNMEQRKVSDLSLQDNQDSGLSRNRSDLLEAGQGEKDEAHQPFASDPGDFPRSMAIDLKARLGVLLLLMWLGNWAY